MALIITWKNDLLSALYHVGHPAFLTSPGKMSRYYRNGDVLTCNRTFIQTCNLHYCQSHADTDNSSTSAQSEWRIQQRRGISTDTSACGKYIRFPLVLHSPFRERGSRAAAHLQQDCTVWHSDPVCAIGCAHSCHADCANCAVSCEYSVFSF